MEEKGWEGKEWRKGEKDRYTERERREVRKGEKTVWEMN